MHQEFIIFIEKLKEMKTLQAKNNSYISVQVE